MAETPRKIQSIENKIDFIEKNMQKRDYYLDSLYIKRNKTLSISLIVIYPKLVIGNSLCMVSNDQLSLFLGA